MKPRTVPQTLRRSRSCLALAAFSMLLAAGASHASPDGEWTSYEDPEFGIVFEHPAHWSITPPDRRPGAVGATFVLTSREVQEDEEQHGEDRDPVFSVQIGVLDVPYDGRKSLVDWADLYDRNYSVFDPEEIAVVKSLPMRRAGQEMALREVESPLGSFAYTLLPWGETMWFVWTDIPQAGELAWIYQRITDSFSFDPVKTPLSLKGIYGDRFKAQPLIKEELVVGKAEDTDELPPEGPHEKAVSSSWIAPVLGHYTINCNSTWHDDYPASVLAIDIPMPTHTRVNASAPGSEYYVGHGWDNFGYGNYLKTSNYSTKDRDCILHGHLQFSFGNFGSRIQGQTIAYSGNTGSASTGPHLHYHVSQPRSGYKCSASVSNQDGVSVSSLSGVHIDGAYPGAAGCGKTRFPSGWYFLYNGALFGYADVQWGQTNNGQSVWVWSKNGTSAQLWRFQYHSSDDTYEIIGKGSNKCLASNYPTPSSGYSNVFIWSCDGKANQRWRGERYSGEWHRFKNKAQNYGSCLDSCCQTGSSSNTYYFRCYTPGPNNQLWMIYPRY